MNPVEIVNYKNRLTYREFKPSRQISEFIDCYWWFENNSNERLDFTILPDGAFDLIIFFDNNKLISTTLTGIYTKESDVTIGSNQQLFGIKFKLLAADYVLKKRIAEYLNSTSELDNSFWGIKKLDFASLADPINHFNHCVNSELNKNGEADQRKKSLFALLKETKGQLQVEQYAKRIFWSSRQINRYFNERFGLSLKTYCNILRVHSSLYKIKFGQLFTSQHHYDQSHFIKSVKQITGVNPKRLQENENDRFLQLLPTDRP